MTTQLEYWKQRCEAAENYIDKSPCDPDITGDQIKAYAEWRDISRTEPPAPEAVGEADEESYGFKAMAEYRSCFPEGHNAERFNGFYDGFITGSRWRGEQGACVSGSLLLHILLQKADIVNEDGMPVIKYVEKPNGGSVAYVRHDSMVKTLNSIIKDKHPCCGARWDESQILDAVRRELIATNQELGICEGLQENDYMFIGVVSEAIKRRLQPDESPCTCQSLPTREDAEKWATDRYAGHPAKAAGAVAMYDWLASHQKPIPTRSQVNEWCNAHSSMIAANPMYAIRKFYNWIFNNKK
jgi:hypothetical protein